jgi:MFS family permease
MIEIRLGLPSSFTQRATTELLSTLGFISIISAPIIGHFADLATTRKYPLLLSLLVCVIGTMLVATTISLPAVYAGRVLQGIAATGAWIVGFAMLTDAAAGKDLGKMLGIASSFITAGVVCGPAAGGVLLELVGYWWAWAVPLTLLAVVLVARLAILEDGKIVKKEDDVVNEDAESAPLLPESETPNEQTKSPDASRMAFHKMMLTNPSVWAAMFNITAFALTLSGFDATLPLHLRDTFGWGSASIGSIFLGLQIPGMCLGPFVGGLQDRFGLRWPTSLGWALLAPLLWFSGIPGKWDGIGEGAFIACIIAIGVVTTFVRGAGMFQLTCKSARAHVWSRLGCSNTMDL